MAMLPIIKYIAIYISVIHMKTTPFNLLMNKSFLLIVFFICNAMQAIMSENEIVS